MFGVIVGTIYGTALFFHLMMMFSKFRAFMSVLLWMWADFIGLPQW
jgi:hypothetical protein